MTTTVLSGYLCNVPGILQVSVQAIAHIFIGALLVHLAYQSHFKLRLSIRQTKAWGISLERELDVWVKEDMSNMRVEMNNLWVEVRNLRSEKEKLGKEVRRLIYAKEDLEEQILENEAELDGQRGGAPASWRQVPPVRLVCNPEVAQSKTSLQMREDVGRAYDFQLRDVRAVGALNRELEDKLCEAVRVIRSAEASTCLTCSLRSSILTPLTSSIGTFERDNPPSWSGTVTQSCRIPEPPPPNPDRNRRQITLNDPPGGEGEPSAGKANGDVGFDDSILSVVDQVDSSLNPSPSPSPSPQSLDPCSNDLEDYHVVTAAAVPGFGDFFFLDSYFDLEGFEPVDHRSGPVT